MRHTKDRYVLVGTVGLLLFVIWSVTLPAAELGDGIRIASESRSTPTDPERIGDLLSATTYASDVAESMNEFVFLNGPPIHRYLGYATFAGAMGTGLLGWLNPESDLHSTLAYATTGLAVASTGAGIITYARDRNLPLGHIVLSGLGTIGFAANLFVDADDDEASGPHQLLGTAATAAFALSVVWVITF